MGQAELRAVFKLINSPDNKKVLDDNKNDIQRAVSSLGATVNKDILKSAFGSASPSFIARNPQLFAAAADAGKKSGEFYSRGFFQGASKFGGGKDLAKIMGLPDINDLTRGTIKGLREITGKDLSKVTALGDINDIGKYKGATPPLLKDVQNERLKKMGLGIITAMFNPWIGSRLLSDAVGGGAGGGKGGSIAKGIFGAGGAFGFSEFYIAITAIKKAIELVVSALKWGAEQIKKAINFAHELYGKSLTSGVGLAFTAKRQMAADVLGVDEKDIFRFAQAAMVMRQLSDATDKIAKSAPNLAYVSAQFKILEYNILADASVLADKMTPALVGFTIVVETFLKLLEKNAAVLKAIVTGISTALFGQVATAILSKGGNMLGAIGKASMAANGGGFGQPQSFMKQLPVGAFEKMGLIIGGGMADKALEYQRRSATYLQKIAGHFDKAQSVRSQGQSWWMNRSPTVAGY